MALLPWSCKQETHERIATNESFLIHLMTWQLRSCKSCLTGKMTKSPFNMKGERAKDLLELIHSNVCGPISHSARDGYGYFITNDLSRYGCVYLMRHKIEVFDKFKEYENEVENQLDKSIKTLRSDRRGEYLSNEFSTYLT